MSALEPQDLAEVFALLDAHPFKARRAAKVVHDENGVTTTYDEMNRPILMMPTEDYEACLRWKENQEVRDGD